MKTKSSQQTLSDENIQQRAYLFTWLRGLSCSVQQRASASSNESKCDLGEWTPYAHNCLRIYEKARDDLGRYGDVRCAARARLPLHHWLAPAKTPHGFQHWLLFTHNTRIWCFQFDLDPLVFSSFFGKGHWNTSPSGCIQDTLTATQKRDTWNSYGDLFGHAWCQEILQQ